MVAIRHDVGDALSTLADPSRSEAERIRAATHLGDIGDRDVVLALAILYGDSYGGLKSALAYALGRLNAVEVLTRQLAFGDARARARAAEVLALFACEAATVALAKALSDADVDVRINAACALVDHADSVALPALEQRLWTDESKKVRAAAAQAIGAIPKAPARAVLERATRTETDVFVIIVIERAIQRRIDRGESEHQRVPSTV